MTAGAVDAPDAAARLRHLIDGRPMLFAIATLNAITGAAVFVVLAPLSFGGDVDIFRRGAEGIADGVIAQDFLYSPLAGLVATPLTWVPFTTAAVAMSLLGAALIAAGVALDTRGLPAVDRGLVAVAAFGFAPVVNELLLGQITILLAAAVWPLRDRDGLARGIPLGLALALAPKPMLIPLLAWALLRRRRGLVAALGTAVVATGLGLALLGPDIHVRWMEALLATGQITRPGNVGFTGMGLGPLVVVPMAVALGLAGWALLADERRGFVAALLAGLLLTPFTFLYMGSILLVGVRPALAVAGRWTRALALVGNPATIATLAAWAMLGLVAVAPWRRPGDPSPGVPPA